MTSRNALFPMLLALLVLGAVAIAFLTWDQRAPGSAPREQDASPAAVAGRAATSPTPLEVEHETHTRATREKLASASSITVTGQLLADERMPLAGATVRVARGKPEDRSNAAAAMFQSMARGNPAAPAELSMGDAGSVLAEAIVQGDGSFALAGLHERDLRLELVHRCYAMPVQAVHGPEGASELFAGVFEPILGGCVRGRVVGAELPAKASVQIATEMDPMAPMRNPRAFMLGVTSHARTETSIDGDGWFEFRGVPASPQVSVFLRAGDRYGSVGPFALLAGETHEVVLEARVGASLTVTVVAAKHSTPIVGAAVRVTPGAAAGIMTRLRAGQDGRSDAAGQLRLDGLWPGANELTVDASGFVQAVRTLDLVAGKTSTAQVALDAGLTVHGIVLDPEGKPVANAGIQAVPAVKVPVLGDVTTMMGDMLALGAKTSQNRSAADGRFQIGGLADEDTFGIAVAHADFLGTVKAGVRASDSDVRITLQRGGAITGRVLGPDNATLPQFTAETIVRWMMVMERPTRSEVFAAHDGRFALRAVPPGRATLRVSAPGHAPSEQTVKVDNDRTLDIGDVVLQRSCAVHGVILSETGAPIAGAQVRRKKGGFADNPMMAAMTGAELVLSDARGHFALDDLPPGDVVLLASARGFASGACEKLTLRGGEIRDDVEIRLGHGGSIHGKMLLAAGASATAWNIVASQVGHQSSASATVRFDGTFRLDNVDPGSYQVQAFRAADFAAFGQRSQRAPQPGRSMDFGSLLQDAMKNTLTEHCLVKSGEVTELTLDASALDAEGIALTLHVLLGSEPLQEGWLELVPVDTPAGRRALGVITDGHATIAGLAPGKLRVQVATGMTRAPVGEPQTIDVAAGRGRQEITLRLPAGEIDGRVVHDATGEPLEGALVKIHASRSASASAPGLGFALTDAEGRFAFKGLREDSYSLVADDQLLPRAGGASGGRVDGLQLAAGERRSDIVLRAKPAASVVVEVTDSTGAPVPGAMLLAVDEHGQPVATMSFAFADAKGRARFAGLPSGSIRVAGKAQGLAPGVSELQQIEPGQETTFRLALTSGTLVLVRVERDGAWLSGATISCRFGDGPWIPPLLLNGSNAAASGHELGTYDLGMLPQGRVRFRVQPLEGEPFEVEREVPQGQRATLILSVH